MSRKQALYSYPVRNVPPVQSAVWSGDQYLYVAANEMHAEVVTYPQEQARALPCDGLIARHVYIPTELRGGTYKPLRRFIEIKRPAGTQLAVTREVVQPLRGITETLDMHWRFHRCLDGADPAVLARISMARPEQTGRLWSNEAWLLQNEPLTFDVATADLVLAGIRALVGSLLRGNEA